MFIKVMSCMKSIKYSRVIAIFILACASLLYTRDIYACAACGCTLARDWDAQGVTTKQGFAVDLTYDSINQNQLWYGKQQASSGISPHSIPTYLAGQTYDITSKPSKAYAQQLTNNGVNNNEDELKTYSQIFQLGIAYTGEGWGVNILAPFISRSHTTNGQLSTVVPGAVYSYDIPASTAGYYHETSNFSSLGDVKLLARYSGFSENSSSGFLYGVKLPTGATNVSFNDGVLLDRSLQPGTGSTDALFGGYFTGGWERLGWYVQGLYQHAVSTTGDYRPGDAFFGNIVLRYGSFGQKIVPALQVNYVYRQPDTGSNATVNQTTGMCTDYKCILILGNNPVLPTVTGGRTSQTDIYGNSLTGGQLLYAAPGMTARLGEGTIAYGFVQIPVYQNVNSLQLTARYIVSVGIRHYL